LADAPLIPHPVICWLRLIAAPMLKNQPEPVEIARFRFLIPSASEYRKAFGEALRIVELSGILVQVVDRDGEVLDTSGDERDALSAVRVCPENPVRVLEQLRGVGVSGDESAIVDP
jgi:hypothetical protein